MSRLIDKVNWLSPVEEYNGLLFKRDDKFQPFDDLPINGGKVRQAIQLCYDNLQELSNGAYCRRVYQAISVNSMQCVITSKVAKEFGLSSVFYAGATNKNSILKNNFTKLALMNNSYIELKGAAYKSVLNSYLDDERQLLEANNCKLFDFDYGHNIYTNTNAIVDVISYQVQNLPDDLDNLVVPLGSGIQYGAILKGLLKYKKKVKNIYGIQISGIDQFRTVYSILNNDFYKIKNDFIVDKTYKYSEHLKIKINDTEYLDPVYEAKAFDYMTKHLSLTGKTLFWIMGNSLPIRNMTIKLSEDDLDALSSKIIE